jgi:hypothetical protein
LGAGSGDTYSNKWTHISFFRSGEWLIDGVFFNSTFGPSTVSQSGSVAATTVNIGSTVLAAGKSTLSFNGMIDEVRAWSKKRTIQERSEQWGNPIPSPESEDGLIAYWLFDENAGTETVDSSKYADGQTLTLTGTTGTPSWVDGLDGDSGLRGQAKPLTLGRVLNAKPALVGVTEFVYQWHDGIVNAINAVYDQGVALIEETVHTDLFTFLTDSTITAGSYNTYLDAGLVMLGVSPNGQITGDVDGAEDADGNYLRHYEELVREAVTTYGGLTDPDDLDTSTFTDLENFPEDGMGIYIAPDETPTVSAVCDMLAASVGGWWYVTTDGNLRVGLLRQPSTTVTLAFTVDDDTSSFDRVDARLPTYLLSVGYQKNYNIQDADAVDVTDSRRLFLERSMSQIEVRDADVLVQDPSSIELGTLGFGLISEEDDARGVAENYLKIFGRHVKIFQATNPSWQWLDLNLFDTVRVTHDRWNLDEGEEFRVLKTTKMIGSDNSVQLVLWQPERVVVGTHAGDRVVTDDSRVFVAE